MDVHGYCLDDPINFYDRTGLSALVPLIGGIIRAGYNIYDNYKDWKSGKMSIPKYLGSIGLGGATGMASTLGGGSISSLIMGAGSAAANEAGNQYIKTGKVGDKEKVVKAGIVGTVGSFVGKAG